MSVSFATVRADAKAHDLKQHLLRSSPQTVHWGYWDGSLAPNAPIVQLRPISISSALLPRRPAAATTAWPVLDEIAPQSVQDPAWIKQNSYASPQPMLPDPAGAEWLIMV